MNAFDNLNELLKDCKQYDIYGTPETLKITLYYPYTIELHLNLVNHTITDYSFKLHYATDKKLIRERIPVILEHFERLGFTDTCERRKIWKV